MSDTTLITVAGWGARTGYCGVNTDGGVGQGEIGVIVVLMGFGAGMARLMSGAIYFTAFCVSSLNEREGTVVFGSTKIEIMYVIDWRR